MTMLPGSMTGSYYVRAIRPAFQDARHWLPAMRDRAVLRRHALKLRFWGPVGMVEDLDWDWIQARRDERIGEVRIGDVLGGCDNLRVITWHPKRLTRPSWNPTGAPVLHIWILAVFQKKRDEFTKGNLKTFDLRRQTVIDRFYDGIV
ncbi:MAG: hypothetical protein ACK5YR_05785 [Pirellula sp.]